MEVLFWEEHAMLLVMFPGETCDPFLVWIMDYLMIDNSPHNKLMV